jgi:hypothetical protein
MAIMSQGNLRSFAFLPLTIRIETLGGIATPLVLRGTPLPAVRSETFSTASDNQSAVELSLLIGESSLTRNNLRLGKFKLEGIPPQKVGVPQVRVEFSVDKNCTMITRAILEGSKLSSEQTFTPPQEFSDSFISKMLADAELNQADDEKLVRQIEATNQANRLIAQAEEQLKIGSNTRLSEAVAVLGLALASGESDRIREKSDALANMLSPFINPLGDDLFASFFRNAAQQANHPSPIKQATQTKKPSPPTQKVTSTTSTQQLGKIFGGGSFTLDPQLCFVLMPFTDRFQPIYDDHIRPAVERAGLRCERADEIRGTNLITWDIWEKINRARFLIADLTDRNPNVFYELGLAHAISKDVILLTQSMDFVPFDLKALRCITYEFTPRGVQSLEKGLSGTIAALMKIG